ncbi:hypothetical protein QJS10_CPA01g01933 [Acorus calamus]|uniref:Peptidase A1 domain-containing protein n=1 Tax=Acorus calamus TaxID=4465 RepID=A0AAV9FJC6_ACOCL|nr:hypothetical protein QJS10_CPA01g01933 [Acorus calamus]
MAGAGFIAIQQNGFQVCGAGYFGWLWSSPLRAEAIAITRGLQFVRSKGYRRICICSDSESLIRLFQQPGPGPPQFQECWTLWHENPMPNEALQIYKVPRECVEAPEALARHAHETQETKITNMLIDPIIQKHFGSKTRRIITSSTSILFYQLRFALHIMVAANISIVSQHYAHQWTLLSIGLEWALAKFDEILQQDLPCVDYLYRQSSSNNSFNGAILPVRIDGNYLVSVRFGTPHVDRHVLFDTGSSLTWTSCHGYHSHSYTRIPLGSSECNRLPFKTSAYQPACGYDAHYSDGARIKGVFGHDALALGRSEAAREFMFGCSYEHQDRDQGLLGLGRSWISLFEQARERFDGQFSYCLPTPSSVGHLTLGCSQYAHSLSFTPLLGYRDKEHYYVEIHRHRTTHDKYWPRHTDYVGFWSHSHIPASCGVRGATTLVYGGDGNVPKSAFGEGASIPRVMQQFAGGVEVVVEKEGKGTVQAADVSLVCMAFAPRRRQGEEIVLLGSLVQIRKEVSYRPNADREEKFATIEEGEVIAAYDGGRRGGAAEQVSSDFWVTDLVGAIGILGDGFGKSRQFYRRRMQ